LEGTKPDQLAFVKNMWYYLANLTSERRL